MRWALSIVWLLIGWAGGLTAAPKPESVAILFNEAIPESRQLAEHYCEARGIPKENLIGLKMPDAQEISRQQYDESIAQPLRHEFDKRRWWQRGKDAEGLTVPLRNQIRVLVTMRGVPLKIKASPAAANAEPVDRNKQPFKGHDEASVDSELAMVGVEVLPLDGATRNAYYRSDKEFDEAKLPFMLLTCRIDAPTQATCERMIKDAIQVEKTGLWGMAYVDIANKFPQGDQWLEAVVKQNLEVGIPTVVDRFNSTLPTNYPMTDAAMYFGWYDWNVSGPFLNPNFKFRKGAVAMHLHSYSAQQIRDSNKNWSGGLLERGAAVTLGNVYEPYLHLTHDYGLLQERLLEGFSWVEACWMSMPVTSWQGVIFGDPMYRPFMHLDGTGVIADADRDCRALVMGMKQWKSDPTERIRQLKEAAVRMKSGVILEAFALESLEAGKLDIARSCFLQAKDLYQTQADKLRQDLHLIAMQRRDKHNDLAIQALREAAHVYTSIPEVSAVRGWLDILDPPPPPPAVPPQHPSAND